MCPDFHLHWSYQPIIELTVSLQSAASSSFPLVQSTATATAALVLLEPSHRHARPRWQWKADADLCCVLRM